MNMERLYAGLSFEQAVDKYIQTVYSVCVMRLSGNSDVDDCVQNTFIKLYEKSPDFNDENHLKAWLLRVAVNECRMSIRRSLRLIPLDTLKDMPLPRSEDSGDLSRALMKLGGKYREVLYLHYEEGYKVREIAEILNTKEGTVSSLLKRGRDKLKKYMEVMTDE